jgi:hypothetical protein
VVMSRANGIFGFLEARLEARKAQPKTKAEAPNA